MGMYTEDAYASYSLYLFVCLYIQRVCVKYLGKVGGRWPTLQRGHWFSNANDVATFRKKMSTICRLSINDKKRAQVEKKKKKYKMSIYQRDLSR